WEACSFLPLSCDGGRRRADVLTRPLPPVGRTAGVVVISQLPPPTHGSTLMTKVFLEVLDDLGIEWRLVDRRFSRTVGEVGSFKLRKVGAAAGLVTRLLTRLLRRRPAACIFFVTTRPF